MKGRAAVIVKYLAGRERCRIEGNIGKIRLSAGEKGFVRIIEAANDL